MAGIISRDSNDNTIASNKLYKGGKADIMNMKPGSEKAVKNKEDTRRTASMIEHFIEKNSGEYDKKKLYAVFSDKIDLKDFKRVIAELREAGKIAIDRKGVIVWIWYPELRGKYLNPKNLIF